MGAERQGFMMDEDERYATAVHEAGHVAVGLAVENGDPIHKVSILPRGRALGVTQSLPERDRFMKKREYLEDQIALLLGGRAAEQVLLSTMTAGASNDIERAVEIARAMVSEFGMSRLGPIHLGQPDQPRSQSLLDKVEEATNELINRATRACLCDRDGGTGIDRTSGRDADGARHARRGRDRELLQARTTSRSIKTGLPQKLHMRHKRG